MNNAYTFNSETPMPPMPPMSEDALITAYALGELEGEAARVVERRTATDVALRREIEGIRTTACMLRNGFAAEPASALTEAQRQRIMRSQPARAPETESLNPPAIFRSRTRWVGASLAAAAVLALTVTAAILFRQNANTAGFARNTTAPGQPADESQLRQESAASGRRAGISNEADRPAPGASTVLPAPTGAEAAVSDALSARADRSQLTDEARAKDSSLLDRAAGADDAPHAPAPAPGPPPASAAPAGGAGEGAPPSTAAPSVADQPAIRGDTAGGSGGERSGAAVPADPESARPRSSAGNAPAGATGSAAPAQTPVPREAAPSSREESAKPRPGDWDTGDMGGGAGDAAGNTGGLRSRDSAAHLEEAERSRIITDEEIDRLSEGEVKEALAALSKQRGNQRNGEAREQLRRQATQLTDRLRAIRAQAAAEAEEYARLNDNPFIKPAGEAALSTFAADVDTASYSNIRRFLNEGRLPPADAVRIEEMINYFRYDYEPPTGDAAFSANIEVAPAPWNPEHRLVRVGLRGKEVRMDMRQATSLVFLIDVSGSMRPANRLPLVKDSLKQLLRQLHGDDRLGIVTYAGNAGVALDSCYVNAENREAIDAAIDNLQAGGSTNGAGGIAVAYDLAREHFIKGGINRVILCTDGDFNVGVSGDDALVQLIEEQRKSGVFLTVLGFGTGNFKDAKMEKVADAGNGNFAYIDSINEARKVLVEQMGGTLVTIAKDVKFQVEFNPAKVGAYRLIGYENRLLAAEDFNNDLKDAGEIGSGHTMTALYEVVPPGKQADAIALNQPAGTVDELEFQKAAAPAGDVKHSPSEDLLILKIRAKAPEAAESTLTKVPVADKGRTLAQASADFRFAAAVAEFGMLLRHSPYRGAASFARVLDHAEEALGGDPEGYRLQFIELVRKAQALERGEP